MGSRIDDGFPTTITFANAPTIKLYEKEVTPPGIQAGGANDTTTMKNTAWRTKAPKKLKTLTDSSFTAAYATEVYSAILAQIGVTQEITIHFPDESTYKFWGWLDEFTPQRITEGTQPTAEVKIIPSNQNASGVEAAPTFTDATAESGS